MQPRTAAATLLLALALAATAPPPGTAQGPTIVAEYTGLPGPLLVFAAGPLPLEQCGLAPGPGYYVAVLDPSEYRARIWLWQDKMRINITLNLILYQANSEPPEKACETTVSLSDTIPLDAPLYLSNGTPAPVPPFLAWRIGEYAFAVTRLSLNATASSAYSEEEARQLAGLLEEAAREAGIRGARIIINESHEGYRVRVALHGYDKAWNALGHYILIGPPPGEEYRRGGLYFPSTETGLNTHVEVLAYAAYTGRHSRAAAVIDGRTLHIIEELNDTTAIYAVLDNLAGHPLLRLDKYLYHWPQLILLKADIRVLDWQTLNLLFTPTPAIRQQLSDPRLLGLSPSKTIGIIVTDPNNLTSTIRLYTGDHKTRSKNIGQALIDQLAQSIRNPTRNVTIILTHLTISRDPPTLTIGKPGPADTIPLLTAIATPLAILALTRKNSPKQH